MLLIILANSVYAEEFVEKFHWADGRVGHTYYKIPEIILKDDMAVLNGDQYENNGCGIEKACKADVNNDGEQEYIIAVQLEGSRVVRPDGSKDEYPRAPYAAVFICTKNGDYLKVLHVIMTGDVVPDFQLADIDMDGAPDIIARGFILSQWNYIEIVSWQKDHYSTLFKNEAIGKQYVFLNERIPAKLKIIDGLINDVGRHRSEYPITVEDWVWANNQFVKTRETIKPGSDKSFMNGKNVWKFGGFPSEFNEVYVDKEIL